MALEYTLELATNVPPEAVLRMLSTYEYGFQTPTELRSTAQGVTVIAANETDLGRAIIKEAYQLDPAMYLKFRLDKFDAWETGLRTTIKATLELLRNIEADGILLFNGETPVLQSVSGRLILNNAHDFWDQPALLSLVNVPYEMRRLASL